MGRMRETELDHNVRRAIQSGLYIVERGLNEIARELTQSREMAVLYQTRSDVDDKARRLILEKLRAMHERILRVKEEYELHTETYSLRKSIYIQLMSIWTILQDLRPETLLAYGDIDVSERKVLEGFVKELLALTDSLRHELSFKEKSVGESEVP